MNINLVYSRLMWYVFGIWVWKVIETTPCKHCLFYFCTVFWTNKILRKLYKCILTVKQLWRRWALWKISSQLVSDSLHNVFLLTKHNEVVSTLRWRSRHVDKDGSRLLKPRHWCNILVRDGIKRWMQKASLKLWKHCYGLSSEKICYMIHLNNLSMDLEKVDMWQIKQVVQMSQDTDIWGIIWQRW